MQSPAECGERQEVLDFARTETWAPHLHAQPVVDCSGLLRFVFGDEEGVSREKAISSQYTEELMTDCQLPHAAFAMGRRAKKPRARRQGIIPSCTARSAAMQQSSIIFPRDPHEFPKAKLQ